MTSTLARRSWSLALASVCVAGVASAHISVDQGGTQLSRSGDGLNAIKDGPCGVAGSTRSTHVYTYKPGETVHVALIETIPHPSYFRIAFDNDGDDNFVEPQSIAPIDPARPCPFNAADKCGPSDYYNNATVLMDDLNPHMPGNFNTPWAWDVKMPDVTCDNCTLQIIQVMEDTIHGAYNPTPGDPADNPYVPDIYHQCIDLTLTNNPTAGDGGTGAGGGGKDVARSGDSGGCSIARPVGARTTSLAWLVGACLGVTALRRRSRRAH